MTAPVTPEPDAGDVEALAAFLHREWCRSSHHRSDGCQGAVRPRGLDFGKAERILASDWLAAHVAAKQAEALRGMAQMFRDDGPKVWGGTWLTTGEHVADLVASWCDEEAASIGGES